MTEPATDSDVGRDAPSDAAPNSTMARLRKLRQQMADREDLILEVAGYEGELAVAYGSIPRDELGDRLQGKGKDDLDMLIGCCKAVMVREGEEWVALSDDASPFQFDTRLAEYLDIEAETARETVEGVFQVDAYPLSVAVHVKHLIRWMEGAEVHANEGLLGE